MAAPLYLIGQTPVNRGVFRLGRTFCRGSGGEPERLSRDRRDVTADRERRGRRRRGRVEDVDGVGGLHDPEIIHERALRRHRLRPYAGAAGADVLGTQRGHEALERFHERALGERAVDLVGAGLPVFLRHGAEAGEAERVEQLARFHAAPRVALARECEHGVGAGLDVAVARPREVHAEEREFRVRHRVDQAVDQILPLRAQHVVLAAEGHDLHVDRGLGQARDHVGLQPRAVHEVRGGDGVVVVGGQAQRAAQPRLVGAGLVVDAGVDAPAVVTGLVVRDVDLFLEHDEARAGRAVEDRAGRRQSHDPAADDRDVVRHRTILYVINEEEDPEMACPMCRTLHHRLGRRNTLTALAAAPRAIRRALGRASRLRLTRRPGPDEWSAIQVLGHLLDAEVTLAFRIRKLAAEPGGAIVAWDQEKWTDGLRHHRADARTLLAAYTALRAANLEQVRRLSPAQRAAAEI